MKNTTRTLATLAALGLSAVLFAGAQARLKGRVTDSAGTPLEGVTVTLTTPNLKLFKSVMKTDKKGEYGTIVNDATMPYHVKFEKEGFVASEADKKIPVGDIGVVDAKLQSTSEAGAAARGAGGNAGPSPTEQAATVFNEGVDLLNSGNKAAAEAKFLEAVGKNPDLPQGWQALAVLANGKKDWAKTLEYGQKALDLDPTLTQLYGTMANAATQSGDKAKAAEWEAKFAQANPDTPEMLYNKGVEAYNAKKVKDAEALLLKAVEAKPDFAIAHFWLGMASFNLNKKSAAREHLAKYLELDPDGAEAATAKEILPLVK